jgi:hypothetical protein
MAIYAMALDRGGYTASGGAYYDPRPAAEGGRCIRLDVFSDEVVPVTVEFGATPTEYDYEEDGLDISAPVISGNTITFQIQGANADGSMSLLAMFADGAARRVTFVANENQPLTGSINPTDDDDDDPGAWG